MTINMHVIRMDKRVSDLWPRSALQNELVKWHQAWDRYCQSVGEHQSYGGKINSWRYTTFKMICRTTIERIQTKMRVIDALTGRMRPRVR